MYHKKKRNESPERKENIYSLIQKGEKDYKQKQKRKSRSKSKKTEEKSSSVVIKKKNLLNKSNAGSVIKNKSRSAKKTKKRRKTKTCDKKDSNGDVLWTESGREIPRRNGRYDEEETSGVDEEKYPSGAMRKRFVDSPKASRDDLEREYITFTSKLSKRKSRGNQKRDRSGEKMRNREGQSGGDNFFEKILEKTKSKDKKRAKSKKKRKKAKERDAEEEQPRKLTLKTKKKAKTSRVVKKETLADSDIESEADIDEFEDSNFLKGKSLWGADLNTRVKSKSEVKLYRKKKKKNKAGKSMKKKSKKSRKSSIEKILNYDTLPLKDDTLDKFAKLQKRSNVKKKRTRNNSLLSLRSAYSNQEKN